MVSQGQLSPTCIYRIPEVFRLEKPFPGPYKSSHEWWNPPQGTSLAFQVAKCLQGLRGLEISSALQGEHSDENLLFPLWKWNFLPKEVQIIVQWTQFWKVKIKKFKDKNSVSLALKSDWLLLSHQGELCWMPVMFEYSYNTNSFLKNLFWHIKCLLSATVMVIKLITVANSQESMACTAKSKSAFQRIHNIHWFVPESSEGKEMLPWRGILVFVLTLQNFPWESQPEL